MVLIRGVRQQPGSSQLPYLITEKGLRTYQRNLPQSSRVQRVRLPSNTVSSRELRTRIS
ncbi:basic-leucine zipper transcription factor [Phycomyces blakesleeanus NRRL 1555(-)]|uniref:Basic-leucine zipper transcription factor n=1 Tax=Phycomyces blakesleeanus (strain ATCC 8743b / DSM 1359 / FGSC 10004 / NBRC 33097 / NRRL 1555) TaxID=763407 RepID=A0A167LY72_PHYB8|nr:basic-leucine zipper transcription factor [Phycomyces blakesleeanus NRRL 1555(-)]XP_018289378.1 basic-leucine zipper transcription factor [Phycomyces blakesleeanus NRRL 1555(-)]OAD71337.1 basic-leucine zipper transcription factor [Phycomyces blakesleeanus NRRL 1555(-)]OAD71338.1 basic-leucine zipper transcription factor [Phycomyces blakesleeanus NRRL 1555(-)]|eukprot:XP_018289377.1 basic-leucine zipper transcription factor [Phycomyces blakesleeanus NRRL 1555(-)]